MKLNEATASAETMLREKQELAGERRRMFHGYHVVISQQALTRLIGLLDEIARLSQTMGDQIAKLNKEKMRKYSAVYQPPSG